MIADNLSALTNELERLSITQAYSCLPEHCSKYNKQKDRYFSLIHLNIRSINRNFDGFTNLLALI